MPILTPEERIGSTIGGKYRIERILAGGGMGTVFVGLHEWTHRGVAIKILNYEHARDPEVARRFLLEARAAATLKHPNVVDVLDMGQEADGSVYLVLELLEGETLKARAKRGPLSLGELAHIVGPVMQALATAHRKGVVHRDLKPDNIFLSIDEAGEMVPKLLDFGIAKFAGASDSGSTRTGTMVGTPHFMAPEQVRGERDVGPAADVWSMGVVLYGCLSGRLPFTADSTAAVLAKILTERPRPLLAMAPQLPVELGALVDRALAAAPSDRFANMTEMLEALRAAVAANDSTLGANAAEALAAPVPTPVTAPPEEGTDLTKPTMELPPDFEAVETEAFAAEPPPKRRSLALPLGAALAFVLAAGSALGIYTVWSASPAPTARPLEAAEPPAVVEVPPIDEPAPAAVEAPVEEPAPPAAVEPPVEAPVVAAEPPVEPPTAAEPAPAQPAEGSPRRRRPSRGTGGALILR